MDTERTQTANDRGQGRGVYIPGIVVIILIVLLILVIL